ncbi:unnamed protein product [Urochloa decumbens]|uniref:Uncharacterized protein n=1 Tax=Urochloa decumbens TaxID=240449 RepID=A0ABC9FJ77_9POAL
METAAAAMLEAGVGRFSRAPALAAALLAEMWAPLAVALAALATLPSLLRRLQVIVLRLRSRGKEVIQAQLGTYYSSCDEDDDEEEEEEESSDDEADDTTSSSGEEEREDLRRIGFCDAADGGFPWGGAVVRTWQGLPRAFSGCSSSGGGFAAINGALPAVRLWAASTASCEPWWASAGAGADEGGCRDVAAAAEASSSSSTAAAEEVVVGWRRDHAAPRRRRRALPHHVRVRAN